MLIEMTIKNLAVIEFVQIECRRGFHVLTGETGAGKSIIIDALSLIIGGRGSVELVRHGCDKAEIECTFELPVDHPIWNSIENMGIEAAKEEFLIIRREMTASGKSTSRINGQMVNLSMLREIGEWLVNIHGQHEHQSLLKVEHHLHLLDIYDGQPIIAVKEQYRASYSKHKRLIKELKDLEETSKQGLQMMDLYRFQIEEIESAELKVGEDELLLEEKQKLANSEKLFQATSEAYDHIYGSQKGLDAVSKAMGLIEGIISYDTLQLKPVFEPIQSAYYQLEDAAHQLRDYRDGIEFNPERLNEIESRLNLISTLYRKYGNNIEEILHHLQHIKIEVDAVQNKDERIQQLEKEISIEHEMLMDVSKKLTAHRKKAADSLANKIEMELKDLHMERTRFEVKFERSSGFTEDGLDHVEFMISANPGEPLKSLSKIASGGELSRIMLALKSIFASSDRIPVLVFDEVDTGVSGRAAQAIAEKMSKLSNECQVFSITHLPQVACMADEHYAIQKQINNERTFTRVNHLNDQDQINELARMLGGARVTETTEQHAKEILNMAKDKKQQWNHLQ